jgi:flagellar FliJ protein
MNRSKRMQPVQDLMEDAEKRLARSLADSEKRVLEAQTKLAELERYLGEYQRQLTQRVAQGMGVLELRDYQAFMGRLNDAIRQQQAVVQRACADRDAERTRWQEAARRAKAIDHVVDQWQLQERKASDRREQIEIDERAQRARPEQ